MHDDYATDIDESTKYRECHDCGATLRGNNLCHRCGPLKRMLSRIESIQLQHKLALSVGGLELAERYCRIAPVWIRAARMYTGESLRMRRARRFGAGTYQS